MSDSGESGFLPTLPRTPSRAPAPSGATFDSLKGEQRLETGELIGKGGMGVVLSATDLRLKRPMAMKQATSTSAADLERFVREARVQGQLQHPGIVPVHELGLTPEGLPYFTMKRVRGVTLSEVIEALARGSAEARAKHTRPRLLNAFQSVCQAVEYAHSQGVLHRDLKPANVMLGDFGEVYVLDWGLAKATGQAEVETAGPALIDEVSVGATPTVAGSLMGTPGYMSPELVVGQPATVQSDVFALGSMLFEVLAHERLVPGDTVVEILTATRDGYEASLRKRRPELDVLPELDLVVQKACAREARSRFSTVRALLDALERVLAGERDLELRAEMARAHAAKATAELAAARQSDGSLDDSARYRIQQEVGRALTLDPENTAAFATLLQLLQTPPREVPAEVKASMEEANVLASRASAFMGAVALALLVLFVPWLLAMGSTNWVALGALLGVMSVGAAASFGISRMQRPPSSVLLVCVAGFMVAGAMINVLWVPLIVATPMLLVATVMYVSLLSKKQRIVAVALAVAALLAPYLAWALGVGEAPLRFENGLLILAPGLLQLDDFWTHVLIIDALASTTIFGAFAFSRLRRTLDHAQEKIAFQAWNLKQLLPAKAGEALPQLENTAADPKCALSGFYQGVGLGRRATLGPAPATGR